MMETLWLDLRYSLRLLLKQQPGFALIAIVTLALGIGANTTIFSIVNGILLRPLPYPEHERLAVIWETSPKQRGTSMGASYLNFLDWREQNRVFQDIGLWFGGYFSITGDGEPEQLLGARVSHDLFEILRVSPVMGRTFTAEEDRPGQDAVVILSYELWQRRYSGDRNIIGKKIIVNNGARTIIGVMPQSFKFPDVRPLWVPLALDEKQEKRESHRLGVIARLKPGVTFTQAQAEMTVIEHRIEEANPSTNDGVGISVTEMHQEVAGNFRQALLILLGIVGCVLLVACANVANLMLARATARQKELAVRVALGASRWRIARQLLMESLLLGVAGGAVGLVLAHFGIELLLSAIPVELPFWMNFNLDLRVLGFTLGCSLVTVVIFGVVPALHASRTDINETLKEGSSTVAPRLRSRRLVVMSEIALSFVLLVGAGLMIQSFLRLNQVHPGFNPTGVLTLKLTLPPAKYPGPGEQALFFQQLLQRIRSIPGVEKAGAVQDLPLSSGYARGSLIVEGQSAISESAAPFVRFNTITPGYLHSLGVPLLIGRDFSEADTENATQVTIIDEDVSREFWPGQNPIGKRVQFEKNGDWHTIVGVAGSVIYEGLDIGKEQTVYVPYLQTPPNGMSFAIRAAANPMGLTGLVRDQIRELDPDQPVIELRTMEEVVARSVWQTRLYSKLFAIFAAVTLLLAAVGIYGVTTYMVSGSRHEMGIRMALGAKPPDILKLVVGRGMWLAAGGVASGCVASFVIMQWVKSLLFGLTGGDDLLIFVLIGVLLTLVAFVASYVPARRAAGVNPMEVLR